VDRRRFLRNTAACVAASAAAPMLGFGRALLADGSAVSARAADLVFASPVVDMLGLLTMDWPKLYGWFRKPAEFTEPDFRRLEGSGVSIFHPAVEAGGKDPAATARRWINGWNALVAANPCYLARATRVADLEQAGRLGKLAVVVGFQNSAHFEGAEDVARFHAMGQRVSQLTYNDANRLGSGNHARPDRGLTAFGGRVVAEMNRVGMAIDVSHCGERTAADAIEQSKQPVLITHANCKRLAPTTHRNRSDGLIRRMAKKGGVMGITVVRAFVGGRSPGVDDVLDHFDHVARLVGVEHVGLGSDVSHDAVDPETGRAKPPYAIRGLNLETRVFQLTEGLLARGYSESDVELMLGGNFLRVLGEIWGEETGGRDGGGGREGRRDPFCPAPKAVGRDGRRP